MGSQEYGDKTWKILEHAIHEIYHNNAIHTLSLEELYRRIKQEMDGTQQSITNDRRHINVHGQNICS
ncbi:hypothetical protein M8C21_025721 [Ambrosia artemisiifolia]|uniref:Uncharacterized protein n=1 Tax=Ambrosia artemisiifolia TaxID=4212 RepID=A0AAD5C7A7_AMBAR|nr:hypothetical protein M8C21_025721 [Ambrosia artemisiifolia]